ncbi:hypothetical protein EBA01_00745 [Xanthomonas oryzae pv. oryzae]|nr:hypothetical protein BVV16_00755 [Xanthomonas oryzae pv. oryzae]AUI92792.1 hypothetical protein BVV17_00755 [Xanthomonas oryzae pv. oryzae]AUI96466.1 hypothetical protein BVV18_00760 [Xanthomonas oryzae pv. oryzae]AUJ00137.1 hypothetical protein BVV10_00755 [Xanthomonas oryzae pv. oryzae]AUJ03817.1 hypothetical protein BVV19_00760 [Xanthomonas oryzae pv. oryzae]
MRAPRNNVSQRDAGMIGLQHLTLQAVHCLRTCFRQEASTPCRRRGHLRNAIRVQPCLSDERGRKQERRAIADDAPETRGSPAPAPRACLPVRSDWHR